MWLFDVLDLWFWLVLIEGDIAGVEVDVVERIFGKASRLMIEFLIKDSADLYFKVNLVQLRLRVRSRLLLIFLIVCQKLLVIFANALL